jgi:cysteinyl-tRNA synthetase
MHNGFINVDNQKMSKSLNNFFTVRDISKEYDLEAVRLFMLSSHYRSPINFSRELIEAANASLNRLYTARNHLRFYVENGEDRPMNDDEKAFTERIKGYEKRFDDAMDDDLNTADALGAVFELVKDANVSIGEKSSKEAAETALGSLRALCGVLGFLTKEEDEIPAEIQQMLQEREEARKNKDWKRSDELRDALKDVGYIVEDTKNGQKVRKNV